MKRDAGAGVHAEVAEHHRLDVDGGPEVLGDPLLAAVEPGAVGVPRVEDGAYGEVELLARVLRERPAGVVLDDLLEGLDERAQVVGVEVEVVDRPLAFLAASSASEKCSASMSSTVAPNICSSRR